MANLLALYGDPGFDLGTRLTMEALSISCSDSRGEGKPSSFCTPASMRSTDLEMVIPTKAVDIIWSYKGAKGVEGVSKGWKGWEGCKAVQLDLVDEALAAA